ncbi:metallophosphoesterase [Candidatus Woesearchaeota archaeon]|nr:metallophosphoesterase [Candidatus Woesearchaeota archaeon]
MADIRLLQWSDFHGDLGKYRAVISFANKRKVDAGLDLGDMVQSMKLMQDIAKKHNFDLIQYHTDEAELAKDIEKRVPQQDLVQKHKEHLEIRQIVAKEIQEAHGPKYAAIDDIFGTANCPIYFVPGNHDLASLPLRNAKDALRASLDGPFFIGKLRVFAGTNTADMIPGMPYQFCSHLDRGMTIKSLEKAVKDIKDDAERKAKIKELLMQEQNSIYPAGTDNNFDLYIGHGALGDRLVRRSKTKDKKEWMYPAGAYHLAREKNVPYFGGHTHNAIISRKDGFPGYITDQDYIFEHVFDEETRKLKETIVYRIKKLGGGKVAQPAAPKQDQIQTSVAA